MPSSLVLPTVISAIIGFLLCGVPFGYLIGKTFYQVDLRKEGSCNPGFTNAMRVLGFKPGVATLALDMLKGTIAMTIALAIIYYFGGSGVSRFSSNFFASPDAVSAAFVYAACVLGHIFSPFLGFKGGKGIATGFGAALPFMPITAFGILAIFLIIAYVSKYISLGSISAAIALSIVTALVYSSRPEFLFPITAVALVVVWAHRSNIKKLLQGEERKFTVKKKTS